MQLINLPHTVTELLEKHEAPSRLKRHLQIVHSVANDLLNGIKNEFPQLNLNEEDILFGAATHDIGKTVITEELYQKGNEHEAIGQQLLLDSGYPETKARFAKTHGNWQAENLGIEDLLVALSDKIWKGKRIDLLEEKVVAQISSKLNMNYWEVYPVLDKVLSQIANGTDERLNWQNE